MKRKTACLTVSAAVAVTALLSGCGEKAPSWLPVSDNKITIAVTGDDEFYDANGVPEALSLAAEDFFASSGVSVEYKYYDDDADYHKAITFAKEIAADPYVSAVLSKQETDFIATLADIYDGAEKPFFVMSGCYDETILNGYDYFINDSICASDAGRIMGEYVINHGFKRAVFCHSDTPYEESELRGFQSCIKDSGTTLAATLVGPYTREDFEIAYAEWQLIGVDVVCVSNYNILNSSLVRMLREEGSDIQVVSDYIMDTVEDIEENGEYMDGTAIVPLYMLTDDESETAKKYKELYGSEMSELAVQAYDFVMMTAAKLNSGIEKPSEFMNLIKSEEGYEGLCGTVRFDENGSLIPGSSNMLIFRDGMFRPLSEAD